MGLIGLISLQSKELSRVFSNTSLLTNTSAKAFNLYKQAAEVGDEVAMFNLGVKYTLGEGVRKSNKLGRNEACPCGSGKKYKQCCGK